MDNTRQDIPAVGGLQSELRKLPGVDSVLSAPDSALLENKYGHSTVVTGIRLILDESRRKISKSGGQAPTIEKIIMELSDWLESQFAPTLIPVINATGVIIHTNLGRAPLQPDLLKGMSEAAISYSSLEYDLDTGKRGTRSLHTAKLLTSLTGAEDALVVNNNAAAVLLMLTALCRDKEVIISRGQLVEIGGGFRIPDVLRQSGANLVEVGTTNKTHLRDYSEAINSNTGAILFVHKSNFGIVGFTSEPELQELADLAKASAIPLLCDQGSGIIRDLTPFGLAKETTVQEALFYGADIVAFSGDKLLGGPQAGIMVGKTELISLLKKHPLARAVRADKLCLSALSIVLQSYAAGRELEEIPVWRMIAAPLEDLGNRAQSWAANLAEAGLEVSVISGESTIGGGAAPGSILPTKLLVLSTLEPDMVAGKLRSNDPPVIGRIADGRLVFDPRTVLANQDETLLQALVRHSI